MPLYATILISVGAVVLFFGIFLALFLLNKKVKAPADCPKTSIGCGGCLLNCQVREEDVSIKKVTTNLVANFKEDGKEEKKDVNDENKEGERK